MHFSCCLEFRLQGEFRGETHPARASLARALGGITLGREQGELGADFTALSVPAHNHDTSTMIDNFLDQVPHDN